jgi:WD40 repeat protein
MEQRSLLDQYNPAPHSASLTAADFDQKSGAVITADSWGTIAIIRQGEAFPGLIFQPGAPIYGAVSVSPGGSLVGVGDEEGAVAVFNTWDGTCVFEDIKEGAEGPQRAMRAITFNNDNTVMACLAIDGKIRVYDIGRWERITNWQGFGGESLEYNPQGDKILAIDTLGQIKLLDMVNHEQIDLEMVPGGVRVARFAGDGQYVVAMGQAGIALLSLPEGRVIRSFTAKSSSGMQNIVVSPDGTEVAAVTQRSVHIFSIPDLERVGGDRHGAAEPTQAAFWDHRGVAVGGTDGLLHRPGARASLSPVICCAGFGDYRAAIHGKTVAIWSKNRQKRPFKIDKNLVEVRIDRDGRLLCGVPDDGTGVQVLDARTGRFLFAAEEDTADTLKLEVGGSVVATALKDGGVRWYDLKNNTILSLPWVQNFALSGSGTWLGVITPQGKVHVIDPLTGKDAIPPPESLADVPVSLLSFVNRRPDLLVMDEEGVLGLYDLTDSVTKNVPAEGRDILDFNVSVDRLWGITGGEFAAIRIQEEDETSTIVYADLKKGEVVSEVTGLLPYAWVDPETGNILQPGFGGAIVEMDMHGTEVRVQRALPEGEWIAFGPRGILDSSDGSGV